MNPDPATHLQTNAYLRDRLAPKPGDPTYLHLSDLRLSLERVRTDEKIAILDYGCGGSPYRSLFPNAIYKRADYLQADGDPLDYRLSEGSRVDERDGTFDFILSTQVLEHVSQPRSYLAECHRLLKPGGRLYLTTHGEYPEHACPYDFRRWTGDGLLEEIKGLGFSQASVEKQTTGPRALLQQLDIHFESLRAPRSTRFGLLLAVFRKWYARNRRWIHRMCDAHFGSCRVVTENLGDHINYTVIALHARK